MRQAFVDTWLRLAAKDKNLILVTGDVGYSCLEQLFEAYPEQCINCGLREQHMIGLAAGLAMEGKKVFVYSIASFLVYRGFEQIRNDVCYQDLPVVFVGVGGGLAYGPLGPTHHAIEDLGVMASLPNMRVLVPIDPFEARCLVSYAYQGRHPCYLRLNRSGDPDFHDRRTQARFNVMHPNRLAGRTGGVALLPVGAMITTAMEVQHSLLEHNIPAAVYTLPIIKPLPHEAVEFLVKRSRLLVVMEEHVVQTGVGAQLARIILSTGKRIDFLHFGLEDHFVHTVGKQGYLRRHARLDAALMTRCITKRWRKGNLVD